MSARQFRELLRRPGVIRSLGAHDVFTARLVEVAGLETVFLGGFGTAASLLGVPDIGLVTLTEMADAVRRMALRVSIPVVADGDTGHGELHNVDRANRYAEAGADVCFIEAPQSREELERIPREVSRPLLVNMLSGGVTPILTVDELGQMGYKIVVCPIESLLVTGAAVLALIERLKTTGRVDATPGMLSFDQIKQLLGLDEFLNLRPRVEKG